MAKLLKTCQSKQTSAAFTIVELLVVIVVIGILASITIVSYANISSKALAASLQSDLSNASTQLKMYYATYGSYPTSMTGNCPTAPTADSAFCIKSSANNTLTYTSIASTTFHLTATDNNVSYAITDTTSPAIAASTNGSAVGNACPTGFIPVPGSGTYGTNDFCVMKYEAKIQGNDDGNQTYSAGFTPESRATGTPWVNISQNNAIAKASSTIGCNSNCHLTTEAEWMTIAQNVLSVASNWDNGAGVHTIGTGYIYSGHNDNSPASALAADSSDANGYAGTGNSSASGTNQKRNLTLSNGEVIWDLSGNVWEWTAGKTNGTTTQEPGITGAGWGWREWTAVTAQGSLATNPFPASIGLSGSNAWDSSKGVGALYSSADTTGLYGFLHGGAWFSGSNSGILALHLNGSPTDTSSNVGFRVSR